MTADEQTTGPVWRDRGTIIANQQAHIAELEAACQRLRDDYQGALAQRNNANSRTLRMWERAKADEADAAGLRARMLRLADTWDGYGHGLFNIHPARNLPCSVCDLLKQVRAALAAEPTPAADCTCRGMDEKPGCNHGLPTPAAATEECERHGLHHGKPACDCQPWPAAMTLPTSVAEPHAEDGATPLPTLVGSPWTDADQAEICHHCGQGPDEDGDHSCSCPHSDDDCPDHPTPTAGGKVDTAPEASSWDDRINDELRRTGKATETIRAMVEANAADTAPETLTVKSTDCACGAPLVPMEVDGVVRPICQACSTSADAAPEADPWLCRHGKRFDEHYCDDHRDRRWAQIGAAQAAARPADIAPKAGTYAVYVGPRLATTAYDAARFRLGELETPMGWRLGDVIARLVLDSGAVRPAPVADPDDTKDGQR